MRSLASRKLGYTMSSINRIWRLAVSLPSPHPAIAIKIDSALATKYKDAYYRALGLSNETKQTLDKFIAGFVEDRLVEEIAFFEEEIASDRR